MRRILLLSALFAILFSCKKEEIPFKDLTGYVNPLVGTDSKHSLSNGNTYPAIAMPWGMNFWSPQTGPMGDGWAYTYDSDKIKGFKQTHQPSPWINDYAAFSLMPTTGEVKFLEEERESWFSHKAETVLPHYYKVYLSDYNLTTEITASERAAQFDISFPKTDDANILIDGYHRGSYIKVIPSQKKIIGYCKNNHGGVPENFHNYFVAYFNKDIESVELFKRKLVRKYRDANGREQKIYSDKKYKTVDFNDPKQILEVEDYHVIAALKFKTDGKEKVNVKVASSFISYEQAELNLKREVGGKTFAQTKKEAKLAWNKELNKIRIESDDKDRKTTFYTSLYRTLLFPRKFYELDKNNKVVHYSPYNGKVLPGYMFTDNGFWDTFRAVFPFFTVMYPEMNGQIMAGLVNTYKESGWLPEWASPGHRNCMIGSNSASLIADSYLKGIRGYDINTLYEAILKNTENEGPLHSVGRFGVKYYNELGYVPYDVKVNENVARTLEYAYDDFCIWKLAKELKRPTEEIKKFKKRAYNYKNVFDRSTNFMRGKLQNGDWQAPFVPEKWGDAFTEGSSWHYTWSVFHDPQGLVDLMGGKKNFLNKLDAVFTSDPVFDYSYYGHQIHEITEMAIANMGQYAHGNQPIQHGIYLYNYAGEPWKAQMRIRQVMDRLYTPYPDGLCGDEDNGQTSAWYVFSAMGFYPVCPGTDQYAFGTPLFKKMELYLENGNKFTIDAPNNSEKNFYINKAKLNGSTYTKNFITHSDIQNGGKLLFMMDDKANTNRGIKPEDMPYSMSIELGK
jgi:predicted alpha-1,2-mannosidase